MPGSKKRKRRHCDGVITPIEIGFIIPQMTIELKFTSNHKSIRLLSYYYIIIEMKEAL
ncbi:hypothetical protein GCM10009865_38880 [Aeromicrobium ponti]